MIHEIIPESTTRKGIKILSPKTDITNRLPSIDSYISFLPFVNFLKEKLATTSGTRANFYKYLIKKFEDQPALLQRFDDSDQLNDHEDLMEFLSTAIFPVVSSEKENNFTLSAPYKFTIFSYSDSFRDLFIDDNEKYLELPYELSEEQLTQVQCAMIYDHVLEKYYGIKLNENPEMIFPVKDSKTGMMRYFRIRYDRRFIDLELKGELPPIQDCAVCLNTFRILDLEQQLKKMPLELFEARGFAVWVAEDVTTSESLDQLKKILLMPSNVGSDNFTDLKRTTRSLIGLNDVQIGLMPFVKINDNFLLNEDCTRQSLLGKHWKANDEQSIREFREFIDFQKQKPEPMPITNLDETLLGFATFLAPLYREGIRSYIYYPMQNNDGILGMLELGSTTPNLLTHEVLARLEPAMPLLSLAMLKSRDAFNTRIERLVKEKFTALQPSVEWKFSEAAWAQLQAEEINAEDEKINFDNLYPLYGAIDVRNSSVERSCAIQRDLREHLLLIDTTLDELDSHVQLTLLEELKFKNQKFQESIEKGLRAEDELYLSEFLLNEVEPVFLHLQKSNSLIQDIVDKYFLISQNDKGPLYKFRNEFEQTLTSINEAISQYLEEQDRKLQISYPHYFEKYRTDGVEYNIYIGQTMAPERPFDLLYLKNIRLWQLQSMAEIARITNQLLPSFDVPLETTQLILIYHKPITINFRRDERRFDVEGSYNIRYEVIKKRIDKACIKNTGERLTQPGKIALVYSNQKEALEYEEYIHFLQNKGLLKPGIENLELEELQGVSGLRGLRVEVNLV
ncbi:hypothetical protein GZH53_07475 [Flavihumibacter sp. R14]|nr:hypothetical protein [Flavihumibacter soli]